MKPKTFWIVFLFLCILASMTYFATHRQQTDPHTSRMGENLFKNLPMDQVSEIEVIGIQNESLNHVRLLRKDPAWVIENLYDYPAEFKKILELVERLGIAKIGRQFEASPEILSRLALHDPTEQDIMEDKKAVRILIYNESRQLLTDLLVGKQRESSVIDGGHYLKFSGENMIYLVDQTFRFTGSKRPREWIKSELLNIAPEDIESVTCLNPEEESIIYKIKRPERGASPEIQNADHSKSIKTHSVESVFDILSSFRIIDVAGKLSDFPDQITGFNTLPVLDFQLFDGTVYRIFTGKKAGDNQEGHFLKIDSPNELKWVYVISDWVHQSMVTDPELFFEKSADDL